MRARDVLAAAVRNTFRSKLRTSLTVIAIFIGAFTLSITSAIGSGVSRYIDDQLGSLGAPDALVVTAVQEQSAEEGPRRYDEERDIDTSGFDGPGRAISGMNQADIDAIEGIAGIERVQPLTMISVDYIEAAGSERYELPIAPATEAMVHSMAAGSPVADVPEHQVQLPVEYAEALGFADAGAAVGAEVTLGVSDALGERHEVRATIAGIMQESLLSPGAESNQSLTDALLEVNRTGMAAGATPGSAAAVAYVAEGSSAEHIQAVKDELREAGFLGQTVSDQIGMFRAVIDGIVGVLNGFAVIALIAAGFGIVNTLLMSVQERTREIGLMKAMGMGSGRVFGLFTTEAVVIGLLGSTIGVGVAMLAATVANGVLADTLLADLPGLQLMRFEPVPVATVILVVMAIAFVAGTLPARRAARKHPIDALRYE